MLQHRLATPVIQPRMHFFDKDGKPLIGGKIYSFKVGTDEFKPTYRNSEFTAANQNPILLDQAGSALIYVRGSVQLKIYNKSGTLIEEKIVYQQQMQTQFFDNYGKPLSNGKIWTYDYQSTIKKPSYANADDALLNPNPVVLDENGRGSLSIVGAYRLRVLNKNNVVVGDQDFKRPPAQVLTSRVYPLYFEDKVFTKFELEKTTSKRSGLQDGFNESGVVTFNFNDVVMKSAFASININVENTSVTFALESVHFRNIANKLEIIPENIKSSFSITDAALKNMLVRTTAVDELVTTAFYITATKITE